MVRDLFKKSTYDPAEAEARRPRPAEAEAPAPDLSNAGRALRRHGVRPPDRMYSIAFSVFYHFSAILFSYTYFLALNFLYVKRVLFERVHFWIMGGEGIFHAQPEERFFRN